MTTTTTDGSVASDPPYAPYVTATRALLENQLRVAWELTDYHLEGLGDDDLHWAPCAQFWDVRLRDGAWRPDWEDAEPQPIPVPTIAWLTWHIGWWWSTALAHLRRDAVPGRQEIIWPGDARLTVAWIRQIHADWLNAVAQCSDLNEPATFPWAASPDLSRADMCAWVAVELTKNAAEIGQLVLIRRAGMVR